MKKIIPLLALVILFLTGCKSAPVMMNDVEEFDQLLEGDVIKYDIRTTAECEEGHLPSFMCMGDGGVYDIIVRLYEKEQAIVIIGEDEVVIELLNDLAKAGFRKLYYFEGGYDGYKAQKGDAFVPEVGCGC